MFDSCLRSGCEHVEELIVLFTLVCCCDHLYAITSYSQRECYICELLGISLAYGSTKLTASIHYLPGLDLILSQLFLKFKINSRKKNYYVFVYFKYKIVLTFIKLIKM